MAAGEKLEVAMKPWVESNLADKAPVGLKSSVTLYVNAAAGNDANDGLAAGRAKKTIMAAINSLPKNLNQFKAGIYVSPGVYDENVEIFGFYGSSWYKEVSLIGASDLADTHQIKSLMIANCVPTIHVSGFRIAGTEANTEAVFLTSCRASLSNIKQSGARCGILASSHGSSTAVISRSSLSNNTFAAIQACACSILSVNNVSGTGNVVGLMAGDASSGSGGIIYKGSISLGATTAESKHYGGQIF